MNLGGGVGQRLVGELDVDVGAVEGTLGGGGELVGIELVAPDRDNGSVVLFACSHAGLFAVLDSLAGGIDIAYVDIACLDSGAAVGEGHGVLAVSGNGTGGAALGLYEVVVEQQGAVGKSAVGIAGAILGVLGLEGVALVVNVLDGEGAEVIGGVEAAEGGAFYRDDKALGRNRDIAAGYGAERGSACAGLGAGGACDSVGNNSPAGAVHINGILIGALVVEDAYLAPLVGAACVDISDHVAVA